MLDLNKDRLLFIAPRESAKTTLAVYYLAWWIGHFPYHTNIIACVSAAQARDRLSMVRDIIDSPRYKRVFPEVAVDLNRPNNASELSVWTTKSDSSSVPMNYPTFRQTLAVKGTLKDPTLFASGITAKKIIGRRFSGVALIDDPHDTQTSSTIEQCDKTERYFNENILGGVQDRGRVIVISTRWSDYDLAGRLKEKRYRNNEPIWHTIEIKALNEEGESYWKDWWTVERLSNKRDEVGEIMWQTMYMNNPIGATAGLFRREQLAQDLPSPLPELSTLVVSVDLAETTKASSDWTVIAAVARDKARPYNVYVLDLIRIKADYHNALRAIMEFADNIYEEYHRLDGVLFEIPANNIHADALMELRSDLPIQRVSLKGSKADRLSAVASKAQQNSLYIKQSLAVFPALISELLGFPKARHDDICDALSLPFQWSGWGRAGGGGYLKAQSPYLK